jgi:glycosyltransferase involved in cell wall biosynthesis
MGNAKIMFVQYTNPAAYPPLEHGSHILAHAGWNILFLGTGALGPDTLRFPTHERIKVRQISFCSAGWRQKLHYFKFCFWILLWTLRWRPTWVYASDPLSCPVTLALSVLPCVRVIYHEHDSPNSEVDSQRSAVGGRTGSVSKFMWLVLWARKQLARRAKFCVLPNEQRLERFAAEVGRPIGGARSTILVWNCPSLKEVPEPRIPHSGGDLWVLYHGSIVPSRLSTAVFEALAMLPEAVKLRVIGYETVGHPGYVEELRKNAHRLGITERVKFVGTVPRRNDLMSWCRKCDIGLALMPRETTDINAQAMVGASNKPFDYLASGLALLVSDLPGWRRTYVDPGYGLACDPDDAHSLAAALRWFLNHPAEMREMGERGRQKIRTEWNYEAQFSPVFERITSNV